jgi:hypothetical protein
MRAFNSVLHRSFRGLMVAAVALLVAGCPYPNIPIDTKPSPDGENQAPVIAAFAANPASVEVGETAQLTVGAGDADGDALAYAYSVAAGDVTVVGHTQYAEATVNAPGVQTVTVTVSDGRGGEATKTVDLTGRNESPTISLFSATPRFIGLEAQASLVATVTDTDDDTLTYTYEILDGAPGSLGGSSGSTETFTSPNAEGSSRVRVTVSDGRGGEASSTVVIDYGPMEPVTNLGATAGDGEVALYWIDPDDAELDSIVVAFTPVPTGLTSPVSVVKGRNGVTISSLANGTEYTFVVTAVDTFGVRSYGKTVSATPAEPQAPARFDSIGRGYDVFDPYASPVYVKASRILDTAALYDAGLLVEQQIGEGSTTIIAGETLETYLSEMASTTTLSGSYKYFSASVSVSFTETEYSSYAQQFATIRSAVRNHRISVDASYSVDELVPYLDDRFRSKLNDSGVSPETVFQQFGTHVLTDIYTGGRLEYIATANQSEYQSTRGFGVEAQAGFDMLVASAEIDQDFTSSEEQTRYESNVRTDVMLFPAGWSTTTVADESDYSAWEQEVRTADKYLLCDFADGGLIPVWEFCDSQVRGNQIASAFDDWAQTKYLGLDIPNTYLDYLTVYFYEIGDTSWPRIAGDDEMDIDGDDVVPVTATISLAPAEIDGLEVTLTFDVQEDNGTTRFSGSRVLTFDHDAAGVVVAIGGEHSYALSAVANSTHKDGVWGPDDCDIAFHNIFWTADGQGDDNGRIGLEGTLRVPLIVQGE